MNLIYSLIIGGIAGFLAGQINRGSGFGILINILLGLAGSFVGDIVFGLIGFDTTNIIARLIVSTVGALIVLFVANFFFKKG